MAALLLRLLLKNKGLAQVPEPRSNVVPGSVAPGKRKYPVLQMTEDRILAALDPDGVYDVEVHGL